MIIGLFVRYFKTYSGWTYIPLSNGDRFCGLVGDNGVGKSSVLEALDCFFNVRDWNINLQAKRSGANVSAAIAPVFLLDPDMFPERLKVGAQKFSDLLKAESKASGPTASTLKAFYKHRDEIKKLNPDLFKEKQLIYASTDQQGNFSDEYLFADLLDAMDDPESFRTDLIDCLFSLFEYIYIPQELDTETFTKLENQEIQGLMGETLNEVIEKVFPSNKIKDVNVGLNKFIDELNQELEPYQYKDAKRETRSNVKKNDFYPKLIEAFFSSKVLHKVIGSKKALEISQLSSGEKKKAIIDIAHSFLEKHRSSGRNLILAVDEPEASLHLSACYDQFESLFQISTRCAQVIFATHWYGFLPIIHTGQASIIAKIDDEMVIDLLDLSFYREQIKQMHQNSNKEISAEIKGKTGSEIAEFKKKNSLPHNVRLKSITDFIQSVIASITTNEPYHWLIVEGTSDKIYLTHFFEKYIHSKKLRIVPVGGAPEIKRIYEYLMLAYEDVKDEVKGRVFLLSDTDADLVQYHCPDENKPIRSRRIVFSPESNQVILVKADKPPVSPITTIESALDGESYLKTIRNFTNQNQEFDFLNDNNIIRKNNTSSFNYLDLKVSQQESISKLFEIPGNKYLFAQNYVSNQEELTQPEWIKDIAEFLFPKARKK